MSREREKILIIYSRLPFLVKLVNIPSAKSMMIRGCSAAMKQHLIADEFSAELSDGLAYVAGQDDESRPVMIFRMKQDYQKLHSQKLRI
ncbi:hypothetical protein K1719_019442 [Acacia pycnantha]|nr:hypothetical protein K1719_019442 [Acacia pycnantha]